MICGNFIHVIERPFAHSPSALFFLLFFALLYCFSISSSKWGRKGDSDWGTSFGALSMMLFSPCIVWLFLWSCSDHDCSLYRATQVLIETLTSQHPAEYQHLWNFPFLITREAAGVWSLWLLAQFILYSYMPGPLDKGQPTPAGYTLSYCVNGWNVWWFCHLSLLAILYFVTGFESATIVPRNWLSLFWIANIAGWTLAVIAYIKAHIAPTHANDNKFSGSFFYDLYMGIEHNPRLSSHPYSFDFKIFFNGRPGICAWTLINACMAAAQYFRFGFVTNSMIIVNFLQAIYVLDFFWNEGWYLRTIDICHEHFGFYL
jgi:7-dehydrocholesterol reductase